MIADQLTQLVNEKNQLADNLITKGVEATHDETFTTLVPKVLDISGGGEQNYFTEEITYTLGSAYSIIQRYITRLPQINTQNNIVFPNFFRGCNNLLEIPNIDTSKATSMANMFDECSSITTIPQLNTSSVTDMSYMFKDCSSLITIPQLDTSKVTNMTSMFTGCTSLTNIPQMDTSKVTSMLQMFSNCRVLTSVPQMDTSKVTNMNGVFQTCMALTSIPQLDTSKATNMTSMFGNCTNLVDIPELNAEKATGINYVVQNCGNLENFGGLLNLGANYLTTGSAGYNTYTLNLSTCNNLSYTSLLNVLNKLYDIATKGCKTQKVILGSTNLAKLNATEEGQQAIANAQVKGWTISSV